MNGEFSLLVDFVEPDGLLQLALRAHGARVPLFVHPLHGEGVGAGKAANLPHLALQVGVLDRVVDVRDENLPIEKKNLSSQILYKMKFWNCRGRS